MKKNILLIAAAVAMLTVTGCKSSSNAYKLAYEKAVANDKAESEAVAPAQNTQTVPVVKDDNVQVRQEKVTLVSGKGDIQQYAVVCGSFSLKANADALMERLTADGYKPVVAINEAGKTYRVILASYATKDEALQARAEFKAKYPDNADFQGSWLLYNK